MRRDFRLAIFRAIALVIVCVGGAALVGLAFDSLSDAVSAHDDGGPEQVEQRISDDEALWLNSPPEWRAPSTSLDALWDFGEQIDQALGTAAGEVSASDFFALTARSQRPCGWAEGCEIDVLVGVRRQYTLVEAPGLLVAGDVASLVGGTNLRMVDGTLRATAETIDGYEVDLAVTGFRLVDDMTLFVELGWTPRGAWASSVAAGG